MLTAQFTLYRALERERRLSFIQDLALSWFDMLVKSANANAFVAFITIAKEEFFKILEEVVVVYFNWLFKIHVKDLKEAK